MSFFAPTILRVAVALVFFYIAFVTMRRKNALTAMPLPLIGAGHGWAAPLAAVVEFLIGFMFLVGLYTQIAAILGVAAALKYFVYRRFTPQTAEAFFPVSSGTAFLLLAISLSLLLTGAGAYAVDIPL